MREEPRIGVYVCQCGINIAGVIDTKKTAEYAKSLPDVVVAKDYLFMCSAPGQEMIKNDIREHRLNRIVVAACTPAMHENTFRNVVEEAGLNRYLMEMVNIREHCTWVHPQDKEAAEEKAKDLIRMGVAKVRLLEPLEKITFGVQPAALVLGGGVAGMEAALDIAEMGGNVYLIERSPTLGGNTARIGKLAYSEYRGVDVARSYIERVKNNPRIQVFTNSELESVEGSVGAFRAKVKVNPRYVNEKCNLCGECEKICPIEVPNEYEFSLVNRKAIYLPFSEAYPSIYVIDPQACNRCSKCVEVCKPKAIKLDEKPAVMEVIIGAVVLATGYTPYEPPSSEYGYAASPNIITLFQLSRLLDTSGPTKGKLVINGKVPRNIVFILCVGSLGTTPNANIYCSRMCCSTSMKDILEIKKQVPDASIYVLYRDIRTYGRLEEKLYENASKEGVVFVRFDEAPRVDVKREGISVGVSDTLSQEKIEIPCDLVVLAVGMNISKGFEKVRSIVKVGCGPEGFVREAHLKLRPVEAPSDGIFLAGAVTGPKNVVESITAGAAAASKAMSLLSKTVVEVEPIVANVNEDICSGCFVCSAMCPYTAISKKQKGEKKVAYVDRALCKGCGACVAACPSGAMQQAGFKDLQILVQVTAAFR